MSHKPKTAPADPPGASAPALASAEPPVASEQEIGEAIATAEAALRELEVQHGQAVTLNDAEPLEREIGITQNRLRRARGELRDLQRRRAQAEADARAAAQQPHRERLVQLVDRDVPAAAAAFRDALAALVERGTALAAAFAAAAEEGAAAGHPRAGELVPADAPAFVTFLAVGALYQISPRVVEARRLHTAAALDRAVVVLQQLVHQEGDTDE